MKNQPTMIKAGALIDGSGGEIRHSVLLSVADGRISGIEQIHGQGTLPSATLDLGHCTLLPPLVDCHVHLFMSGTLDAQLRQWQLVAGYHELLPSIASHLGELAAHGVLGIRDGGDHGGFTLRYLREEQLPQGVQLQAAGRALRREGRYGGLIGPGVPPWKSPLDAFAEEPDKGCVLKVVNSGLNSLHRFGHETPPQFTMDELEGLVRYAHQNRYKVMVHANGNLPVRLAVEAGCDSIEHGFFMGHDNLARMRDYGTVWVPTVFTMKAYLDHITACGGTALPDVVKRTLDSQLQQLQLARELGVQVATGTDSGSLGVWHGGAMKHEIELFLQAGYSLPAAIRAASTVGSQLLDFGVALPLVVGAPATFLVVSASPGELPDRLGDLQEIYLQGNPVNLYREGEAGS